MSKHVLITGGSGLLGRYLTKALLQKGYTVSHLSRSAGKNSNIKTYLWDIEQGTIDPECITGVDTIIHLAGESVADGRWTDERKKRMIESRTKSIGLIYNLLKANKNHGIKSVVSASGIGYYGDRGNELMTEDCPPSRDFLCECCILWEKAVDEGAELGLRVLKFRTGVVLDKEGGALAKMAIPVKLFIGSPLGSGKQWIPWIHIQDVVDMYLMGIGSDTLSGVYNMAAPNNVTNAQLTQAIAKQLQKPLWAPNVPAFVLQTFLGEMSVIVLGSTKVSPAKIEKAGFKFSYERVEDALKEIYE